MIKALVSDFSKVILFRKDDPTLGKLNEHHEGLQQKGDYDFWNHFTLNTELLDYYQKLSSNIDVYIFTSEYIQEHPPVMKKLKPKFKDIFSAIRLGVSKADPQAYIKLSGLINKSPGEILFIDDTLPNIQAANDAGLITVQYRDNESAMREINEILK